MLVSLLLPLLLLSSNQTDHKPRVKLLAMPRLSTLPYPNRREVRLLVITFDPDESLWCPDLVIDWGDDTSRSAYSETCVPLAAAPPDERERRTWYNGVHGYWAGEFIITVTFFHDGKQVRQEQMTVSVAE